ncbi:MAG: stage III sporulation protein AA [Oscillospiraceae bacterium]
MICAVSRAESIIPLKSAARLINLPAGIACGDVIELRLRAGRCAVLVTRPHRLTVCSQPLTREDIEECFLEACRYSVHSYENELREGFITLDGGHRVGICGTTVLRSGRVDGLREVSSLNIRIAHEIKGCAERLYDRLFSAGLCSALIGGAPLSGKTTVLRDLTRLVGQNHTTALIDTRGELSACSRGLPMLDVGLNTDILYGCPESEGILLALRTLSPEVIICDELSGRESAAEHCFESGVNLIATAHAGSMTELLQKPQLSAIAAHAEYAVFLKGIGEPPEIKELR